MKNWKAQQDIRHSTNIGTLHDGSPKGWAVYSESGRVACITESIGVDWDKDTLAAKRAALIASVPELLAELAALEKEVRMYLEGLDHDDTDLEPARRSAWELLQKLA